MFNTLNSVGCHAEDFKSRIHQNKGGWVDCHSHLAGLLLRSKVDMGSLLAQACEDGVTFFLQGGYSPEEWSVQESLAQKYPDKVGLCFGLHPHWVASSSDQECEAALNELASRVPGLLALGEMGLDGRVEYSAPVARERQIDYFRAQLELAEFSKKPVVLHVVRAHPEALRVLDGFSRNALVGFVHGFHSKKEIMQEYLSRGFMVSIGAAVLSDSNPVFQQAVYELPLERMLLESDELDLGAPKFHTLNVAKRVAEIKGLDYEKILAINSQNFLRLFSNHPF